MTQKKKKCNKKGAVSISKKADGPPSIRGAGEKPIYIR